MNILVIIPARGGSKEIPRKNLRALNNRPLIFYSIQCALQSKFCTDVYITSDDSEILSIAKKLGAKTHKRNEELSNDDITLDPVIFTAYKAISSKNDYQLIVTLQPTSPLLSTRSLDNAIEIMINNDDVDTVIAAKNNTHLSWTQENGNFIPKYTKRVNRQFLKPIYTETGGFLITRPSVITKSTRIGKHVELYILGAGENIDIDTYEDWNICEYYLRKKKILFVVSGNNEIGLGHVYNTLLIANDILAHHITFLVDSESKLAKEKIASKNYPVFQQNHHNILVDILEHEPDVVINDRLDTSQEYILSLKKYGIKTINFEDLGTGAIHADIVVNAIYPEEKKLLNHFFGESYFILRDEFALTTPNRINQKAKSILLTFGGVDPQNLTLKVLNSIYDYCSSHSIDINIVTGLGYSQVQSLQKFKKINVYQNINNISDYMMDADVIFTSAGRTLYEVASLGTPSIVLAQNDREMTHLFANKKNGFIHLGQGNKVSADKILNSLIRLINSYEIRTKLSGRMLEVDLRSGRSKVQKIIKEVIN